MSRKNNPKETIERILTASTKLFSQKGFDKTSMQDIIDASNMSKGAIFYHFKSKEEIFNAVLEKQFEHGRQLISQHLDKMKGLTAKEKLKNLLEMDFADEAVPIPIGIVSAAINSPHLILAAMRGALKKNAPLIAEIIQEGVADGSITTEFPNECAEVFLLLCNFWCQPYTFECDLPNVYKRIKFFQHLMRQSGMDIITDELITAFIKYTENVQKEIIKWTAQN